MPQTTLISRAQIDQRVSAMGRQISADFAGGELIVCCVLKGAMFFCSDLMRAVSIDAALDFIQVSSYGTEKYSSGVVTILKEPQLDMHGKAVLIVEDIIDSGLTIREVHHYIDIRRSLVVTDTDILSAFDFERVLRTLTGRSGTPTTPLQLYRQWFDTQNPRPGLAVTDAPHCDDVIVDGKPALNGFSRRCPTP